MLGGAFRAKHFRQGGKVEIGRAISPRGFVYVSVTDDFDSETKTLNHIVKHFTPKQARKIAKALREQADLAESERD